MKWFYKLRSNPKALLIAHIVDVVCWFALGIYLGTFL